jgi:hypothetical protein
MEFAFQKYATNEAGAVLPHRGPAVAGLCLDRLIAAAFHLDQLPTDSALQIDGPAD